MSKMKNKVSLLEYYKTNKKKYSTFSIEVAFKNLQEDYIADYPEIIKSKNNTMIMVESLDEVLSRMNFNWIVDLERISGLKYESNDGSLINNLDSFVEVNKTISKDILSSKAYEEILELWQNYIGEKIENTGTFINDKFDSKTSIVFIKLNDSKEYLRDSSDFVQKTFGEKESNVSLNFLYKKDDDEFTSNNLSTKIAEHKIRYQLSKNK